jgi:hypothetical protein
MGVVIGSVPFDPLLVGNDSIKFGPLGFNGTAQGSTQTDDWINGQAGNDYVFGAAGNDILLGGDGNDTLNGGLGDDRLSGGSGADVLDGSSGYDFMRGGTGDDVLRWDDTDFAGVWNTVSNPFAIGSPSTFVLGGSHSASTTSTYAGNEDFDVVDASASVSNLIDLSGKNVASVEAAAVKVSDSDDQTVIASLAEMRSENQSDNSSGSGATRDTVFAAVLGADAGDKVELLTGGQSWVYDSGAVATDLSAAELTTLRSVVGSRLSLGIDGDAGTVDLFAYVFTNGGASVTLWTDVALSGICLDGSILV